MTTTEHGAIRRAAEALAYAGMPECAERIQVLNADARTAAQAAAAVGVDVGAIANSLVFVASSVDRPDTPLLAMTSGAHRADTGILARLIGADKVDKAGSDFVLAHTGQIIGGVAPVGHPAPIRTLVDRTLAGYPVIWAAAGHPMAVFPTTFEQLVELTGGTPAVLSAHAPS
ncbi:MAG: YbaK/EbsC family protein [Sciscionella sp.]